MPSTVLIIGGGFAGVAIAKELSGSMNVIIVDKKDFFSVTFANLRAAVQPSIADKNSFLYSAIPGIGTFKQASVTKLSRSSATLDNGEEVRFDYCAICTGATNSAGVFAQPAASSLGERKQELKSTAEQVKNAKSIVVVGAGPVGIELAAEIVETFAGKSVTLVHSAPRLLETKKEKLSKFTQKWLEERGVKVLLNDRLDKPAEGAVAPSAMTTKSGQQLSADLFIWTIGATPNTAFMRNGELADTVDTRGYVKVGESLQVVGFENIFAVGDINNVPETKLGYLARMQGLLTAKNIKAAAAGKGSSLAPWKPSGGMDAMFVSLGHDSGAGHLGGCACTGFPVNKMKSGNLFVDQTRKDLGVK